MTETLLCPYYGKDESYCELGCDYITPHDVYLIVHYCAGQFHTCPKYWDLREEKPLPDPLPAAAGH